MDVNGTRFHLFKGAADWGRCCESEQCDGQSGQQRGWVQLHLNSSDESVMLSPLLSLFKQRGREVSQDISLRRGAARDRFGNWYWIGNDRMTLYWMPYEATRPMVFWSQDVPTRKAVAGAFEPPPLEHSPVELSGLATTENHYLIAGNPSERGFFIFDLDSGGEPSLMLFPDEVPFDPFDIVGAPGGGVWILDRTNRVYWGLDRHFRVIAQETLLSPMVAPQPPTDSAFNSGDDPESWSASPRSARPFPSGFLLDAADPVSIEAMPDGSVLILDSPAFSAPSSPLQPSVLHHYRLGMRVSPPLTIEAQMEVTAEEIEQSQGRLTVVGYDMAFTPGDNTLYVVERDGNQSIAFTLNLKSSPPALSVSRDYLPMHFFGGRALTVDGGQVFYDVVGGDTSKDSAVRWMPLQVIDQPKYSREGTLFTPVLDGKERDCVWHRLFLDGCIPAGTDVEVWSRVNNNRDLILGVPFTEQPGLYLRGAGAEIPFYDPFPDLDEIPENTGTWEAAFQEMIGQYAQFKFVLTGNGRTTPHVRATRIYYPRFSYPKHYLPAVYLEDQQTASFLERLLANTEGFYSDIEGKMADVRALFDARSAPRETLDWLASWLGLILDPLWAGIQEQRDSAASGQRYDRRRLFIRFARKLYDARGTSDGIRFALLLLLDPCLERLLARFKAAATTPDLALRDELAALGLPYPTAVMMDLEIEDLLYDYALAPARPTKIRLVERYLTRGGRALAAGDVSLAEQSDGARQDDINATAHRFSVLTPQDLSDEEQAMVQRVVELEKPAHTQFDLGHYWDFFRVGETRLGLDTVLGEASRFAPMVIGRNYLGESYLHPANPMDVDVRSIANRDRLGFLPAL